MEVPMGSSPRAYLAYGYDLGGAEGEWFVKEYDKHQYKVVLPWFDEDDPDEDEDFPTRVSERLLKELGGLTEEKITSDGWNPEYYRNKREAEERLLVEFFSYGYHESPSYALVCKPSQAEAEWGESALVEPVQSTQVIAAWNAKLNEAIKVLGITPTQEHASWVLMAAYF